MNVICAMFGHLAPQYAAHKGMGGREYCTLSAPYVDGIGRSHVQIFGECARCERRFQVGMAQLPAALARVQGGDA